MIDLALFRKPTFTGAQIVAFCLHASLFSMFLYLTLYLQNVLGYSPLEAGLRFLPISLLAFVVAPLAGKLAERWSVRGFLGAGLLIVACSLLLMNGIEPGDSWTTLLAGFVLGGIGIGCINPPLATAAVGVVDVRRSGAASGINSTFRQVGTATGIAALGAILQVRVEDRLAAVPLPPGARDGLVEAASAGAIRQVGQAAPPGERERLVEVVQRAFIDGLDEILVVAAVVAFVGGVLALALIRRRDFVTAPEPAVAEAGA